jgi:beta-glucosidase
VRNEGTVAGIETVQLYVAISGSAVVRAPADLRAFQRVALEPAEQRRVTMTISANDLAYWDTATSSWIVEDASYEARVGSSSADLPLMAPFNVE